MGSPKPLQRLLQLFYVFWFSPSFLNTLHATTMNWQAYQCVPGYVTVCLCECVSVHVPRYVCVYSSVYLLYNSCFLPSPIWLFLSPFGCAQDFACL